MAPVTDVEHVLVLGGTAEARRLAGELAARGVRATTSLAGRVARPALPEGEIRTGGFGGAAGLARWLMDHAVTAVVDATHPFASAMSANAAEATRRCGVPLVALRRPGWTPAPGDHWLSATSLSSAAALLPSLGRRVFLTTGRLGLAAFAEPAELDGTWFLIRSVDQPEPPLPRQAEIVLDRGPFSVAGERELLSRHRIDVLVTKDSGGEATAAKLTAARELGLPVVVVRRPPPPAEVEVVPDIAGVLGWLSRWHHGRPREGGGHMEAVNVPELVSQTWPFVGAAVGAYGTAVVTRATDAGATATVSLGQRILQRLWRRGEDRTHLERALQGVADDREDEDAQAALRAEIKRLLREDVELARDVAELVADAPVTRESYTASGDRSVAVRENTGVINTGDDATFER